MGFFLNGTEYLRTGSSRCRNGLDLLTAPECSRVLLPPSCLPYIPSDPDVLAHLTLFITPTDLECPKLDGSIVVASVVGERPFATPLITPAPLQNEFPEFLPDELRCPGVLDWALPFPI